MAKRVEDMTTEELFLEVEGEKRTVFERLTGKETDRQKKAREEIERRKRIKEGQK